jgi:Pyruvate/2-oxoacid:ferredoxin oxidoreductase delta subunit
MKYLIHYFSATGNTARAMKLIKAELEKVKNTVVLHRIVDGSPDMDRVDAHIFGCPVLAWAPIDLMKRYIKGLDVPKGAKASVFCAHGGGPLQAIPKMRNLLQAKGFDVVLTDGGIYPDNWMQMLPPDSSEKTRQSLAEGDLSALRFARSLIKNERRFYKVTLFNMLWSGTVSFLFQLIGRRFLGKVYIADEKCNDCGLCVKSCPASTITMKGAGWKRPFWRFNCEDCNRCINICPVRAIQVSTARLFIHFIVNVTTIIYQIILTVRFFPAVREMAGTAAGIGIAIAGNLIMAAGFILLQFLVFDLLLFALQEIKGLRKFFINSSTSKYGRYKAPGFNPLKD